ncbi:hypothetical protein JKP88DRAFT_193175 [Tribonema minus]|uniref:Uncharacterized protein n=1 Tax=Tribonema minus TaxID=303371 RepID=A0A836CKN6_9STRA|nr:hypothetical protein JKP88DRAFT_193175 [Tribonema minus]
MPMPWLELLLDKAAIVITAALKGFGIAILRRSISCSEELRALLTADTVHILNTISQELVGEDDPALILQLSDPVSLHAALQLLNTPTAAGHNEVASMSNFKNWLLANAGVAPSMPGTLAWHGLDNDAVEDIRRRFHKHEWIHDMHGAGITQRRIAMVLLVAGSGRATKVTEAVSVFE